MPSAAIRIYFFPIDSPFRRFSLDRFLQCFSWCFRVSPGFHFSRVTMISHSVLFLDFLRAIIFSPIYPFLILSSPAEYSRTLQRDVRSHAILLRVADSLPARHFSTPPSRPAHTLFLLSEGHRNRIKLYAGFSMPPFPPTAMKGGIRHDTRPIRSEKWEDLIWTRSDEISLASYQTSR